MKSTIVFCITFTLVCGANSSFAGSDFLLELEGVKGESSVHRAQPNSRPKNLVPASAQLGKSGARGAATRAEGTSGCEVCGGSDILEAAHKPRSALLLPAVQKVREAAAR